MTELSLILSIFSWVVPIVLVIYKALTLNRAKIDDLATFILKALFRKKDVVKKAIMAKHVAEIALLIQQIFSLMMKDGYYDGLEAEYATNIKTKLIGIKQSLESRK